MLATFVIGLREGLEASLIIGIIAAFLKQSNRTDALRKVWLGVGAAVLLCLAVGITLQAVSASLPQRQQEMLECVVAAIAVVMVSYMVLWMRKHSRDLKSDLQHATGSALARGSAGALVVMAFLAVLREGFETAVFLLAAFQSALSPLQAAIGVILGVAVAVALGYLIYRGGVKLNLSRFFRITGVVLVLVAAGLVMSTLRAAYEAGWLTVGQQTWLDLSAIARPGSVQESLLTGMLGIRSSLPVVEVVAYLLYAIPMLLVVLWPPRRTPSRQVLGRILVGTAAGALVVAGLLVAFGPAAPAAVTGVQGPFALQGIDPTRVDDHRDRRGHAAPRTPRHGRDPAGAGRVRRLRVQHARSPPATPTCSVPPVRCPRPCWPERRSRRRWTRPPPSLPATLTADEIAALNGGRLPVGVRSGQAGQAYRRQLHRHRHPDRDRRHRVRGGARTGPAVGADGAGHRARSRRRSRPAPCSNVTDRRHRGQRRRRSDPGGRAGRSADRPSGRHPGHSRVCWCVFALVLLAFGVPKLIRRRPATADRTRVRTARPTSRR